MIVVDRLGKKHRLWWLLGCLLSCLSVFSLRSGAAPPYFHILLPPPLDDNLLTPSAPGAPGAPGATETRLVAPVYQPTDAGSASAYFQAPAAAYTITPPQHQQGNTTVVVQQGDDPNKKGKMGALGGKVSTFCIRAGGGSFQILGFSRWFSVPTLFHSGSSLFQ